MAAWLAACPALLAALAVILVPGLIVTAAVRMGLVARVAVAGVASVAAVGIAGVVFGLVHVRFAFWQPLLIALLLVAFVWLIDRRWGPLRLPGGRERAWWLLLLSMIGAGAVIAVLAFSGVPSPDLVSQTYDNVFHMSAIADIVQNGDASSLTLRSLIETERTFAFYPSGWHSLVALVVQLSGSSIPVAVNATWIAVAAIIWIPGAAWLAQVLVRRFEPGTVALVALPLAAAFGGMPYALLSWGTLYPNFLATALLPAALAIPVVWFQRLRIAGSGHRGSTIVVGVLAVGIGVVAVAFGQPRVLVTWFVLLIPLVVTILVSAFRRAWLRNARSRRIAVWTLVVGLTVFVLAVGATFLYAVLRLGLFDRPLDDRLGGPQAKATQTVLAGLWQVVSQSWLTGTGATTWPCLLLAVAVIAGIVVAVRRADSRWIVIGYGVIGILFALAAGSDDVVTKLATALWYKDRFRLSAALPVLGVTFAAWGILVLAAWARRRRAGNAGGVAVAMAWIVATASAATLAFTGTTTAVADVFRMPASHADFAVVSKAQVEFMASLDRFVPADQRVLGDPWDGSGWTQLFGDREPVFPHVNGQWDPARLELAYNLPQIASDPAVCGALNDLRVRFVLYNPHTFGGGDPSGNHFPGPHDAVKDGLFSLISTDGESALYRIDQCGPLP